MTNESTMQARQLGRDGPSVSALGLGCMGFSGGYGPVDDCDSVATIHAALDSGVTYLDTGDFYGAGQNEMLLGQALKGRRDKAFIAVKFGALRGPDGAWHGSDNRPAAVKNFLAYSLQRLGTDYIDLYQPARVDPAVPIEDTVGAIAEMVKAGYVRHIGLSEAGVDAIRRAQQVHRIAALQIEYSLMSRGVETAIRPVLRELGIALVAYGVLSRGLISEHALTSTPVGEIRSRMPRFQGDNLARNRALVEALRDRAREGLHDRRARDRLGRLARERRHSAGRGEASGATRKRDRRHGCDAFIRRSRADRGRAAGRSGCGHTLRRRPDGASGFGALAHIPEKWIPVFRKGYAL
jgi:aryl-alcohol dehydrogenase-like predicted oxidoreductase